MIVARLGDGTFIVGIDANNVRMLKDGHPMHVKLAAIAPGQSDVIVTYGDRLQDVIDELERATGGKLPPAMKLPSEQQDH